jgi:hypothetical protein
MCLYILCNFSVFYLDLQLPMQSVPVINSVKGRIYIIRKLIYFFLVSFMVFNATFNNIAISSLSPLLLWVRISTRARCTTLCNNVCQWLARGRWFFLGPLVSSTNKTDHHDITEILLKVGGMIIHHKQTNKQTNWIGTDYISSCKSNYHTSWPWQPRFQWQSF